MRIGINCSSLSSCFRPRTSEHAAQEAEVPLTPLARPVSGDERPGTPAPEGSRSLPRSMLRRPSFLSAEASGSGLRRASQQGTGAHAAPSDDALSLGGPAHATQASGTSGEEIESVGSESASGLSWHGSEAEEGAQQGVEERSTGSRGAFGSVGSGQSARTWEGSEAEGESLQDSEGRSTGSRGTSGSGGSGRGVQSWQGSEVEGESPQDSEGRSTGSRGASASRESDRSVQSWQGSEAGGESLQGSEGGATGSRRASGASGSGCSARTWQGSEVEAWLEQEKEKARKRTAASSKQMIAIRYAGAKRASRLENLPAELLLDIVSMLEPKDHRAVRYTSRHLATVIGVNTTTIRIEYADELEPALAASSKIAHMDLFQCKGLEDTHVEQLTAAQDLQSLNLGYNGAITDAAVVHLARLPKLKSLNLESCNGLTDAAIASLSHSDTIEQLSLRWNPQLTSAIVPSLLLMKSLTEVDLTGIDGISAEDVSALEKEEKITVEREDYEQWSYQGA